MPSKKPQKKQEGLWRESGTGTPRKPGSKDIRMPKKSLWNEKKTGKK